MTSLLVEAILMSVSAPHSAPFGFISLPLVHPAQARPPTVWTEWFGVLAGLIVTINIHQANPSSISLWIYWCRLTLPLPGLPNWLGQIPQWQTGWRWRIKTGCVFMLLEQQFFPVKTWMPFLSTLSFVLIKCIGQAGHTYLTLICCYYKPSWWQKISIEHLLEMWVQWSPLSPYNK